MKQLEAAMLVKKTNAIAKQSGVPAQAVADKAKSDAKDHGYSIETALDVMRKHMKDGRS